MSYLVAAYIVCLVLLAVYVAVLGGRIKRLTDEEKQQ